MTQASNYPFPTITFDLNTQIIDANLAVCELLKIEHSELINTYLQETFSFNDLGYESLIVKHDANQPIIATTFDQRAFLLTKLNTETHSSNSLLTLSVTEVSHLVQTKQLSGNLENDLTLLHNAVSGANIGIWRYNIATEDAYFSYTFKNLLGLTADAKLSWAEFLDRVHPQDQALFEVFFDNHLEFQLLLDFEFRVLINQQTHWFEIRGEIVEQLNANNHIYGTLIDCTQEKEMMIALNDANESKALAMQAGKIGTWRAFKENDDWVWDWDQLSNEIFKLENDDIGQLEKWAQRVHPEDAPAVFKSLEKSLETGSDFEEKYRGIMPDGEVIYVYAKGVVGKNIDGENCRIDGFCVDQSELFRANEQLKLLNQDLEQRVQARTKELTKAIKRAEQANQTKSDFLAMMSHELRTPMNAIIGSLELLLSSTEGYEEKELINTASVSAHNLVSILNDILDINKIEAGKLEIETIRFDHPEMIENALKTYTSIAHEKNIKLSVYEDLSMPTEIEGDAIRIRQVLFNLLSNAIKFTAGNDRAHKEVTLRITWQKTEGHLYQIIYEVADTGIGINQETQKRLFTPFIQAEKSTTRKFGGTGLGLAISGKLTDMMGGAITLKSEINQGSTFTLSIPVWHHVKETFNSEYLCDVIAVFYMTEQAKQDAQHAIALLQHYCKEIIELDHASLSDPSQYELIAIFDGDIEQHLDYYNSTIAELDKPTIIFSDSSHRFNHRALLFQCLTTVINPQTLKSIKTLLEHAKQLDNEIDIDDFSFELDDIDDLQTDDNQHVLKSGILLVEDNHINQQLITKQLKQLGYQCDIANNGHEGFQAWQKNAYQLILTDCHMPELDGYAMTQKIRDAESNEGKHTIPVIAVTGAAMKGDKEHCLALGMNDFLSKPITLKNLESVINKWYS